MKFPFFLRYKSIKIVFNLCTCLNFGVYYIVVGDLLSSHYAGDEEFTSEKQDNVAFLAKQISPILKLAGVSLPMEISSLFQLVYNDYDPADNNIIIDCKTGTWSSFTE